MKESEDQTVEARPIPLALISLVLGMGSAALFSLALFGLSPLPTGVIEARTVDLRGWVAPGISAAMGLLVGLVAWRRAKGSHGIHTELAVSGLVLGMVWLALVISLVSWEIVCGPCRSS